ncbi:MAG: mechanosensitive ion channel [Acidimicrobiales bacterium]|nr:mechanosensitive ion channel [Acidimicrobiales bacterium]
MTFGLPRAVLTGADVPFAGGVAVAAAILGSLLVVEVGDQILHLLFRRRSEARWPSLYRRAKPAIRALAVSIAGFESVRLAPLGWRSGLADLARVAVIASVAWIAIRATPLLEDLAARRFDVAVADNRRARRARTQLRVVRRVVTAIIVVVAVLAMVTSIPQARTLGASLFASAGVIGIVAGIAGQSTLGNVIAGIQVAFSDRLRIDDLVVVDGEFGTVEEITLTYVVVQLWDQRGLVLPVSHFVTTSFENWTRTQAQLIGSVYLHVDYRVPVEELREELEAAVRAHPLWDRRVVTLQVVDATERTLQLRALASAASAADAWNLRCELREHLVRYVRDNYPSALPRARVELDSMPNGHASARVGNQPAHLSGQTASGGGD